MKKILLIMLVFFISNNISFAEPIIYEKPDVKIIVEGTALQLESEVPIIVNSRTLVPLRKLLVGLGVPDNTENIKWIGENREVKVRYNGVNIDLAIDSLTGYINGKEYTLDSAPIIHRDRTYLPARFVGEALGYTISWDQYTPAVLVVSNENMEELTKILDDLNFAMDNMNSYEVSTLKTGNTTTIYNGQTTKSSYTTKNLEKADLKNKIIYTENSHKDEYDESINYLYNTEDGFYGKHEYLDENGEMVDTGWKKYAYTSNKNSKTAFDSKEKLGIIKIDSSLYGCLISKENNNSYFISATSNQIDILKSLNGNELFNEVFQENVEKLEFELEVNKKTNLPVKLEINVEKLDKMTESQDGYDFYNKEEIKYLVEFLNYNKKLNLEVPNI